jgi:hypothetical protein
MIRKIVIKGKKDVGRVLIDIRVGSFLASIEDWSSIEDSRQVDMGLERDYKYGRPIPPPL